MKIKNLFIVAFTFVLAVCNLGLGSALADSIGMEDSGLLETDDNILIFDSKEVLYTNMSCFSASNEKEIKDFLDTDGIVYIEDSSPQSYEDIREFLGQKRAQTYDNDIHGYIVERIGSKYVVTVRKYIVYSEGAIFSGRINQTKEQVVSSLVASTASRHAQLLSSNVYSRDSDELYDFKYTELVFSDGNYNMATATILQEVYSIALLRDLSTYLYRDVWDMITTFTISPISDRYINWWNIAVEGYIPNNLLYTEDIIDCTYLLSDVVHTYSLSASISFGVVDLLVGTLEKTRSWTYNSNSKEIVNDFYDEEPDPTIMDVRRWEINEVADSYGASKQVKVGARICRYSPYVDSPISGRSVFTGLQSRKNMFNKYTFEGSSGSSFAWFRYNNGNWPID